MEKRRRRSRWRSVSSCGSSKQAALRLGVRQNEWLPGASHQHVDEARKRITSASTKTNSQRLIELLLEQINDLLQRLYGQKSVRFENPNQTDLLKLLEWPSEVPVEAPEALDVVPQQFRVKRYVQGKHHCPEGMNRTSSNRFRSGRYRTVARHQRLSPISSS